MRIILIPIQDDSRYSSWRVLEVLLRALWNVNSYTHPGMPPDSILFASVTSFDQASNCHFILPRTPASTDPVWIPTRMSRVFTPVCLRTLLQKRIHSVTKISSLWVTITVLKKLTLWVHDKKNCWKTVKIDFLMTFSCLFISQTAKTWKY